jgi:hypothetical protein
LLSSILKRIAGHLAGSLIPRTFQHTTCHIRLWFIASRIKQVPTKE